LPPPGRAAPVYSLSSQWVGTQLIFSKQPFNGNVVLCIVHHLHATATPQY